MGPVNDDDRTVWVGNLDSQVTEEILWELFLQAGPLESVKIPKDHRTGKPKNFAFVVFRHQVSVGYVIELMNQIRLYDSPLRLSRKNKPVGDNDANANEHNPIQQQSAGMDQFRTDSPMPPPPHAMMQMMPTFNGMMPHPMMMAHCQEDPRPPLPRDWDESQHPSHQRWQQHQMRRSYSTPNRSHEESHRHDPYRRNRHRR